MIRTQAWAIVALSGMALSGVALSGVALSGVALSGQVVTGGAPLPAARPSAAAQASGNQSDNRPRFAVVSVKRNTSNADAQGMRLQPGGRLVITNRPLRPLILFAYGLQPQQLAGGPDWLDSDRFDILAQAEGDIPPSPPGGPPGPAQLALQRLLEERFGLTAHTEARQLPIYALIRARGDGSLGPRIRPSTTDCVALMAALTGRAGGTAPAAPPQLPDGRPACGIATRGPGRMWAGGTTLQLLATLLSGPVGRMVEDRTGLAGGFDLDLEFAPEQVPAVAGAVPDAPPPATDRPSLFTAIEEQLGLKLQPQGAPVNVMVIDRAAPPAEN